MRVWDWLRKRSSKPKAKQPDIDINEVVAEFERRNHFAVPVAGTPAWALLLRSPFASWDNATSWFGGCPSLPPDFVWPRSKDGVPAHFVAQIDLATLAPEPVTGRRPAALPRSGALLVFFGAFSGSCHVLTPEHMKEAVGREPPDDTPPLTASAFWSDAKTFPHWPLDPFAYLDSDGKRPATLPDRFASPRDWIINWGIAALEADVVIQDLKNEL